MFPGLVLIGLALVGAVKGWRTDAWPAVVTALALVLVGVGLSFGPEGAGALYTWVADVTFGFHAIRAPARFAAVAFLGVRGCEIAAQIGCDVALLDDGFQHRRLHRDIDIVLSNSFGFGGTNVSLVLSAPAP